MSASYPGSLLQFDAPTPIIISGIKTLMLTLPSNAKIKGGENRDKKDITIQDTLERVLAAVAACLDNDYDKNLNQSHGVPWDFDYVVIPNDDDASSIHVLTRLHHPSKGGNILYGRTIKKLTDSVYVAWIDD